MFYIVASLPAHVPEHFDVVWNDRGAKWHLQVLQNETVSH